MEITHVSVCGHSHGRISWLIFTKIGRDVKNPKRKKQFVGGQYRTTPSPILSSTKNHSILDQEVLKIHASVTNICALNVCESPKFSRH